MSNPLDHPVFSGTEADWHPIEDLSEIYDSALAEFILAERQNIADYCTRIFQTFIKEDVVGTQPLIPNDILVRPMGNDRRGFVAYVDFAFPASQPYDSDSWWMIVGCVDTTKTVFPDIRLNPWSFGWFCQ